MRIRSNQFTCRRKHRNNLAALYRGKLAQEMLQRVATLQVVKKCAHRNARPYEYRRATEYFRVRVSNAFQGNHVTARAAGDWQMGLEFKLQGWRSR